MIELSSYAFPKQRVSSSEKDKIEWYGQCIDWIIAQGQNINDPYLVDEQMSILKGDIPEKYYKKILNPYNATDEKYKRFPADMRNYDMIQGILRRYVSEYTKNPHDFIVGANNPEVILARNAKLRQEVLILLQNEVAARIQESYNQFIQQGGNPEEFNPREAIDIESFTKEFNENYIDEISAQGQEILAVIRDVTDDMLLYTTAYFHFVAFGRCYTYTDIIGNKLVKRVVHPRDAFPIPNDSFFVEDYDMFAEKRKLTYQQIIDEFGEYLTEKEREFLDTYYARHTSTPSPELTYSRYQYYFGDKCSKFDNAELQSLSKQPNLFRDLNTDLYDVWHVVWRGEARVAIVTYVNQIGMITQRMEVEDYELNKEAGDISIEYIYKPQVYEGIRIGARTTAIYPYKYRAIAFERNGKLPYNGITELLPGFGKFSIIDLITPYQVFYNIVAYHREMTIAKNKLSILLIAKSLLGKVPEDTIYKMLADGVLYIEDENDQGMLRAQQVRMVNASVGEYISQLTQLLNDIENTAKMKADMTPQRYGEIANSAGKGVTEEAIVRGSMGSVILEFRMDTLRERDYARDMDYSKLAWIDGLDTSYRDFQGKTKYLSLNVNNHIYADYVIKAKNSVIEKEKLEQLRQFAFSAAQNGDSQMAIAAIEGDNVASIKKLINKYQEAKEQHEVELKQLDQQLAQMQEEFKLEQIAAQGEQDRATKELEGVIKKEIALIQADANRLSYPNDLPQEMKDESAERIAQAKTQVEREKIRVERERIAADNYNKERDRQVKEKDIAAKIQIAKSRPKPSTKK